LRFEHAEHVYQKVVAGLEGASRRKRRLRVFLIVLINAVITGSVGSFLVLSQPSVEPDPYVSSFQWSNFKISPKYNTSYALVEGTIVNPRTTAVSNVTLALDVYVHYICHHDVNHHTCLKREEINFGNLLGETSKSFSVEVPYQDDPFYSFRYVGYKLSWTP
jgi:hypothetical protein